MNYAYLRGSDGTGPAVLAHITSNRAIGSTVIVVDSLDNWPTNFIVTTGTLNADGLLDPATITEMSAHQSGGNIVIDGFEPGFTDLGNTNNQVAVIKPTSGIINRLIDNALVSHKEDGTIKDDAISSAAMFADAVDPEKRASEMFFDHVASGCIWSGDSYGSTRNGSMTAGVVYIGGKRVVVAAVTGHLFSASKDTYVDVRNDGVVIYTEVANNANSPTALSNGDTFTEGTHLRLAIVVTGAGNIANSASINQGQEDRVLPIISSVPLSVADSNGNLIYNRSPQRKLLAYRQRLTGFSTSSLASTQIPELSAVVKVPLGRKIKVTIEAPFLYNTTAANRAEFIAWLGSPATGTILAAVSGSANNGASAGAGHGERVFTPASTSITINVGLNVQTAGTATADLIAGVAGAPIYLRVELE